VVDGELADLVWAVPRLQDPHGSKEQMMRGPVPKDPSVRARRNRTSTNAILRIVTDAKVPALPADRQWHPYAAAWWTDAWSSPMRQEWTTSDEHGIVRLLALQHAYWSTFDEGDYKALATLENSFNASSKMFGLSPMSRRALQWQIEQGEAAEEKTTQRRKSRAVKSGPKAVEADPRELLA
jgi:hypothetical protein